MCSVKIADPAALQLQQCYLVSQIQPGHNFRFGQHSSVIALDKSIHGSSLVKVFFCLIGGRTNCLPSGSLSQIYVEIWNRDTSPHIFKRFCNLAYGTVLTKSGIGLWCFTLEHRSFLTKLMSPNNNGSSLNGRRTCHI